MGLHIDNLNLTGTPPAATSAPTSISRCFKPPNQHTQNQHQRRHQACPYPEPALAHVFPWLANAVPAPKAPTRTRTSIGIEGNGPNPIPRKRVWTTEAGNPPPIPPERGHPFGPIATRGKLPDHRFRTEAQAQTRTATQNQTRVQATATSSTITGSASSPSIEPTLSISLSAAATTNTEINSTSSTIPTSPSITTRIPSPLIPLEQASSAAIAADQKPGPPVVVVQQPSTPTVPTLPPHSGSRHDSPEAMQRKIWVKRPGASPTRVGVAEDDLVDNVRDAVLQKYANSLGRSIDAPDITLKIISRDQNNRNVSPERALGPEEPIGATLDAYYPGGQTVDEALIIDVPSRRTPRPSPRAGNHHISYFYPDTYRPDDAAREYFPPMPVHSPHIAHVPHPNAVPHAMSVLTTGHVPPLPSPGSHGQRRHARPKYGRQHTSSPTIMHTVQPNGQVIESKSQINGTMPTNPPLSTPPAQGSNEHNSSIAPPNRVSSPHPGQKPKRRKNPLTTRSTNGDAPPSKPAAAALLDGTVPPINVLLVEDNVINLKLLEAFMKRLKVRWKSAMNGKEAVAMWRTGGFHLVLMDIQLPVMNGLEATKEIRRLEAVNGIGVFSGSPIDTGSKTPLTNGEGLAEADVLPDRSLFKSPVIIVALTASSLQIDRHEALAAGCNDFLTKPVNFVWMERKVTEWGCMQALIDFDGWRKWKQYAEAQEDPAKKVAEEKDEKAKTKAALKAMFLRPPPSLQKDGGGGAETSSNSEKTLLQNGTPKKSISSGVGGASGPKGHRISRSNASGGGSLESMAEEDEKGH
ncbi:uncharacterized protein Z518_01272 [Rhinocladiella mackenziei CBS 650.93]|uniref:Response regulatory domain-containing protein n=1 Tax=Rhinocladiella mackenziei CBS 650.93 TaxID=1442369 RepID=A0A0D2J3C1_9EURO|nr:uncharacterized protein Z518_01272 [Rhinocladiella mackenziei CBS 650.93]KIX10191.1 hypothetical protein Z518_01272 [Rhinocladiella mackenziei CBS 650.93]